MPVKLDNEDMKGKITKIGFLIQSALVLCSGTACNNGYDQTKETDFKITEAVCNFPFLGREQTPGSQLSYSSFWDGTDTKNLFGPPLSLTESFFTYKVNVAPTKSSFFAIYAPFDAIEKGNEWLRQNQDRLPWDSFSSPFFDDQQSILDGKVLFSIAQSHFSFSSFLGKRYSSIEQIPSVLEDKKIVFCCEEKALSIQKNVSTGAMIHRDIPVMNRVFLREVGDSYQKIDLLPEGLESVIHNRSEKLLGITGDFLLCFPDKALDYPAFFCPLLGLRETNYRSSPSISIFKGDAGDEVMLPILGQTQHGSIDLLSESEDFSLCEDVFGQHKSAFKDALLRASDDGTLGYFDFTKVASIIRRK